MIKKIIVLTFFITSLNAIINNQDTKNNEDLIEVEKTINVYEKLIKDDAKSMFWLASRYLDGKTIKRDISKAIILLKKASALNHNKSTYNLGKIYLSKKTIYHDLDEAYKLFFKLSNQGYAPAQNMIGKFLVKGVVMNKDYKMAVRYFEKASKQDYIDAQCNLSFMYASGKGVFPNFGRAHQFAKKGYNQGNKRCIKVWKEYNLKKYPEDKGWKFKFYNKP